MGRVVKDSSILAQDGIIGVDNTGVPLASFNGAIGVGSQSIKGTAVAAGGSNTAIRFVAPNTSVVIDRVPLQQWTLEGYMQWAATPAADETLFNFANSSLIRKSTNAFAFAGNTGSAIITSGTSLYTNNTLIHWAITRNASNLYTLWINGVSAGTATDATVFTGAAADWYFLTKAGASSASLGYLSAVRFTNGVCRYTAGFSPSGSAWPTTVGGDANWNSVVLLMNGDERTSIILDFDDPVMFGGAGPSWTPPLTVTAMDSENIDTVFDAQDQGTFRVKGTTKVLNSPSNTPISRYTTLEDSRTNRVVRAQWSDPVTGAYSFDRIKYDPVADTPHYNVNSYDYLHSYRAVIADNLTPEAMP